MERTVRFQDRQQAGRLLGERLKRERPPAEAVVLGLPRGGVVVAYEVAAILSLPLDVLVVRKLGVPDQEELAMGALAAGGGLDLDEPFIRRIGLSPGAVERVFARERKELERRESLYRRDVPALDLNGREVIVVDDGLATGSTMRAALASLRRLNAQRAVVAVPVASAESLRELEAEADGVVCLETPPDFAAVGQWYVNFGQTTDDEVRRLLERSRDRSSNV